MPPAKQRPKGRNGLPWGLYLLDFRGSPEGQHDIDLWLPRWLPKRMADKLADRLAVKMAEAAREDGYKATIQDPTEGGWR